MQFQVGEQYSAAEIQRDLEVGNAGGIRVSMNRNEVKRVVLLTAAPSAKIRRENPYHDRVEGDVLVYSAGGLSGDQTLGGFNRRLSEQGDARFPYLWIQAQWEPPENRSAKMGIPWTLAGSPLVSQQSYRP